MKTKSGINEQGRACRGKRREGGREGGEGGREGGLEVLGWI